jgi:drug/metabolite transporter (DMT)-like permease
MVPMPETAAPARARQGLLFVGLAALLFSTSPLLARQALLTLSPDETAFWRLLIAGAAVLGVALLRREPLPARREWPAFVAIGLAAAAHFVFYIASLDYTTVAHSLALVYTAPVFVALLARLQGSERLTARRWTGIVIVVAGAALLAGGAALGSAAGGARTRMLLGDLLALGSAITFAFYSLAGRSRRTRHGLFAYAGSVYLLGALWALPLAAWNWSPTGYTSAAIASLLALALLPMAVGHTLYNAALRRTSAAAVNVVATQELTLGLLWAALWLGETPTPQALAGVALTLLGTLLVVE